MVHVFGFFQTLLFDFAENLLLSVFPQTIGFTTRDPGPRVGATQASYRRVTGGESDLFGNGIPVQCAGQGWERYPRFAYCMMYGGLFSGAQDTPNFQTGAERRRHMDCRRGEVASEANRFSLKPIPGKVHSRGLRPLPSTPKTQIKPKRSLLETGALHWRRLSTSSQFQLQGSALYISPR